ncbi:hypothetical protein MATL_G00107980 [Megalops atlanticus]|uniref:Uncharacterized protein n=1 Tax=Megalops atlanticus TaxID=7932 RepID=A0A9D3T5P5_MEGAT|nr:hypothetical protein MATL_G00107980 [Megalops atlanticus]
MTLPSAQQRSDRRGGATGSQLPGDEEEWCNAKRGNFTTEQNIDRETREGIKVLYFSLVNWANSNSNNDQCQLSSVPCCTQPLLQKPQPNNNETCLWSFWLLNTPKTKTSNSLGDHIHMSRFASTNGQRMVGQCGVR